ncbi:MAG: carbonate dehydratase [Planctomycetes bacterium]|nr:carbonate dehydratase [Planctomycetota bacterium]
MTDTLNASLRQNPNGDSPKVDPSAYIDHTALVIGNVCIGPKVYVGPNAVIRADETDSNGKVAPIKIEEGSNVQDAVIIHALAGTKVTVGKKTSLAHGCIIHGPCSIGDNCFIGFRAIIFKANIANNVMVATAAVVQEYDIEENSLVPTACKILSKDDTVSLKTIAPKHKEFMKEVIAANLTLVKGYNKLK